MISVPGIDNSWLLGFVVMTTLVVVAVTLIFAHMRHRTRQMTRLVEELRRARDEMELRVRERTDRFAAANEALRASDMRKNAILDAASDCMITMDDQGRIVDFNPMAEKTFGHARADAVGRPLDELIMPERYREAHRKGMRRYLATGKSTVIGKRIEIVGMRAGGGEFPVELSVSVVHVGDRPLFSASLRDITDRKAAELQLNQAKDIAEAAAQSKSKFLAIMSHEIRTPMNGILGMARLLLRSQLDGDQRTSVNTMLGSADSLLRVLNDILDMTKLEAGHISLVRRDFDLNNLVDSVVWLYGPQAQGKGVELAVNIAAEIPRFIRADPDRLRQILSNLVNNALTFTDEGAVVLDVELIEEGEDAVRLRFSISDTGIGIDEGAQATLFKDFTQADPSIARRFGGTGLGLSICKRLVELMGGEIGLRSQKGQGSVFWFDVALPRGETPAEDTDGAHSQVLPALRILLAEDNDVNQLVLGGLLQSYGHEIDTVDDGVEAVDAVERERYDVVLMDVHMPRMNGIEATQTIRRSHGPHSSVPIIAVTAGAMDEDIRACLAAGMNGYLSKPVEPGPLFQLLAGLVGGRIARDTHRPIVAAPDGREEGAGGSLMDLLRDRLGAEAVAELIVDFERSALRLMANINAARDRRDFEEWRLSVHSLKGAAVNVGLDDVARAAAVVEAACRDANFDVADRDTTRLDPLLVAGLKTLQGRYGAAA